MTIESVPPLLTEWTEQALVLLRHKSPIYEEVSSTEELFDVQRVKGCLESIDWDFGAENTSYLAHDIHPYPAKFVPQIPGHLIANLSVRGDLVLDPFGGSGTTAFEAVRLGRRALSIDANLVGVMVGRVKTARIDVGTVHAIRAVRTALLSHLAQLPAPEELVGRYSEFVPDIPNISKWFSPESCGELALIRSCLSRTESPVARDIASVAMSRIITRVSFQDSETRYASKTRSIRQGETVSLFLSALKSVVEGVAESGPELRYGVTTFEEGDARNLPDDKYPSESVDLVVTSPPYGNANDYHLYHRFRLFWLGADPRLLANMEIGSHLRHQKERTGYSSYRDELLMSIRQVERVLRPGRFAAFVIGDSLYEGREYSGSESVCGAGVEAGLDVVTKVKRNVHGTKRSFVATGRRLTQEWVVVLRKPERKLSVVADQAPYRLWPYEETLRFREFAELAKASVTRQAEELTAQIDSKDYSLLKRAAFSHSVREARCAPERTWQAILENGSATCESSRKDPKYVTHGLHAYKGKFYPQLVKSLINLSGVPCGATVLDPFCGSGTAVLEGHLNGFRAYGCDLNPLATKIARAKVAILEVSPPLVSESIGTLLDILREAPSEYPEEYEQFKESALDEIERWFPALVVRKLNWILRNTRSLSAGTLQEFLEVVLSSVIREVSQQEISDLRIRRRRVPINDADVVGLFRQRLETAYGRLVKFWLIRGYAPNRFYHATVLDGDARDRNTCGRMGLGEEMTDLVVTSPPYATALPYIDTDRLSLLVLLGMRAGERRPLEERLTGSREIKLSDRTGLETRLVSAQTSELPNRTLAFIQDLHRSVSLADVGFRRKNMPALLFRFFLDMKQVFRNVQWTLKKRAVAMVVIGDNVTNVEGQEVVIPTSELMVDLGRSEGLELVEEIPITVTTEDVVHIRNAIRRNSVLVFRKS